MYLLFIDNVASIANEPYPMHHIIYIFIYICIHVDIPYIRKCAI